jgi:hypothetical protein
MLNTMTYNEGTTEGLHWRRRQSDCTLYCVSCQGLIEENE